MGFFLGRNQGAVAQDLSVLVFPGSLWAVWKAAGVLIPDRVEPTLEPGATADSSPPPAADAGGVSRVQVMVQRVIMLLMAVGAVAAVKTWDIASGEGRRGPLVLTFTPVGWVAAAVAAFLGWLLSRWLAAAIFMPNPALARRPRRNPPPEAGHCPRCARALHNAAGELGEDTCEACHGHFLPVEASQRLLTDHLGFSNAMLKELTTHFAGTRLSCPSCLRKMSPVTLKGVHADLCDHCGGLWLDKGELSRLSLGRFSEVGNTPATPE